MKKVLSVIIAVVITLSSLTVVSYAAEKKVPDFTMTASKTSAKVGDTVTVDVKVSKSSRLCAVTLDLVYDDEYFEVVSATQGRDMTGVINETSTDKVRFTAAKQEELQIETVLFTVEFKVLKTGGSITLEAAEVCTTKSSGSSNWNDVTSEVKEKMGKYSVNIACAHAVKETVTVENATCAKAGSKQDVCKECGWKSEAVATEKLPHDTEELEIVPPTCTEKGKKVDLCKNCDYEGAETEIPATGHTEGDWVVVKEATKTEKGLKQKKCTVCDTIIDEEEIPVIPPYKLGDVNEDGEITAVDARAVLRFVAGLVELDDAQKLAADTNKDGTIAATDARLILQYVVGKATF